MCHLIKNTHCSDRYTISCIYGDSTKGFEDSASPAKPQFLRAVLQPIGSFKVVLICHLLLTYWLTYFVTYLIRRTRRRAISDVNKDNELHLPLFLFAHLFAHFLLCLSIYLFSIQTPIYLLINNLETCANPSPCDQPPLSTAANAVPMMFQQH